MRNKHIVNRDLIGLVRFTPEYGQNLEVFGFTLSGDRHTTKYNEYIERNCWKGDRKL